MQLNIIGLFFSKRKITFLIHLMNCKISYDVHCLLLFGIVLYSGDAHTIYHGTSRTLPHPFTGYIYFSLHNMDFSLHNNGFPELDTTAG